MLPLKVERRAACCTRSGHNPAGNGLTPFLSFHSELSVHPTWPEDQLGNCHFLKHLFFSPTKTESYILSLKKKILVWLQSELCDDCPAGGILEYGVSISIVVTTHMSDNIYIKDQLSYSHPNFQTLSSLHSQQVQAAELGLVLRALCLVLSQG